MLGWTQDELAARSGVSKRSIAGFELESIAIRAETMKRIVATFSESGIDFGNPSPDTVTITLRNSARRGVVHVGDIGGSKRIKAGSTRAERKTAEASPGRDPIRRA